MSLILVADLAFRVAVFWFDLYHPCGGVALWCDTLLLLRVTLWAQSRQIWYESLLLAYSWGDHGRWARGVHGSRALEAGTGAAECRSWPASWGDHGRWARGVHGSRALEAGTGAAGCRSWPASWGDHGRGPSAVTVPERWRPVPVRQGAGAGPPAGVIMAGGPAAPWCSMGSSRWRVWVVPRSGPASRGDHGRGSGALTGLLRRLQEWVLIWGETQGLIP